MDFCFNQESPALVVQSDNIDSNQNQPSTSASTVNDGQQHIAFDLNQTFGRPHIDLNEQAPTKD